MVREKAACTMAAGVMLIVCAIPTLSVGLILTLVFNKFQPTYITGFAMLGVAGVLVFSGFVCSMLSCVYKHKKRVQDVNMAIQSKMRRGSQTTTHTTATMDTVATRLTIAPPLSSYAHTPYGVFQVSEEDDESPPPAYISALRAWDGPDSIDPCTGTKTDLGVHQEHGLQRL